MVGHSRGTIYKVLVRHGCLQRRRSRPRQTFRRYEWAQPGALLHIDAKTQPKFDRPGHWADGDRSDRSRNAGDLVVISVVHDHSRLGYSELHGAETALACATTAAPRAAPPGWQSRASVALGQYERQRQGLHQPRLPNLPAELDAHIPTPPYTPCWNGKLERFNQTLDAEMGHARIWPDSHTRDRALASFLYNRRRPHTSLGDRPPISRVSARLKAGHS